MNIKLSKKKVVDRLIRDMNEAIENLNKINETEVELIPEKYLKQMSRSIEIVSVVSDMVADMEYEG